MKIYWWNMGLHLRPESKEEYDALILLTDPYVSSIPDLKRNVATRPVRGQDSDEDAVVSTD